MDPESRRLSYVAGGTSKVEVESSQELLRRLEGERQIGGIRGDSDSEALPKSAHHNLVSERRFTDGQQVLGTQDKKYKEVQQCPRLDTEFTEKWDSLHPTTCCVVTRTSFV